MDNKMRQLSMSSHSNFFSSINQVEKRIKLEHTSSPTIKESQIQSLSLSSPMFLNLDQDQPSGSQSCTNQDSSEAPQAFLSISQGFPLNNQNPSQTSPFIDHHRIVDQDQEIDEIEQLMQFLGMSEEESDDFDDDDDCDSCHCESGFYSKIVGVKGPKCKKEVMRLNGWIKHFLSGDGVEKQEPLRLAHLLLGKAAFISEGDDAGFGGLDFPSTVQEFLHTDPPTD